MRSCSVPHRARYTLIEILISILVLGVAVVGLLSLLIAANRQAGEVVEDSFAATLARSVYESVRVSVREFSFSVDEDGHRYRGFVLVHDGVVDPGATAPARPALPANSRDVASLVGLRGSNRIVFLPPAPAGDDFDSAYVFPRPGGPGDNGFDNGAGKPLGKDNTLDDAVATDWGTATVDIQQVYSLSSGAEASVAPDASEQYSYALVIRRAEAPALLDGDGAPLEWQEPELNYLPRGYDRTDGLYEVRVLVFRNFVAALQTKQHFPVEGGDYVGLVALGP
jgi:type II secretory pathway pseudopilin PulG